MKKYKAFTTNGDFSISNYGKKTTFSFRIPSISKIDFTKKI
jgi:hypothetical protein